MKKIILLIPFILIVISCQEGNFDENNIEILPYVPLELTEGNNISFRTSGGEAGDYERGEGVVVKGGGIDDYDQYYLSSDSIKLCETSQMITDSSQTIGVQVLASFKEFYLSFHLDSWGDVHFPTGYLSLESSEKEFGRELHGGGYPFNPKCSQSIPTSLQILEITDESIKGTFEAEFFRQVTDELVAPFPDNCDEWESVGLMRAAFDVPLTICE